MATAADLGGFECYSSFDDIMHYDGSALLSGGYDMHAAPARYDEGHDAAICDATPYECAPARVAAQSSALKSVCSADRLRPLTPAPADEETEFDLPLLQAKERSDIRSHTSSGNFARVAEGSLPDLLITPQQHHLGQPKELPRASSAPPGTGSFNTTAIIAAMRRKHDEDARRAQDIGKPAGTAVADAAVAAAAAAAVAADSRASSGDGSSLAGCKRSASAALLKSDRDSAAGSPTSGTAPPPAKKPAKSTTGGQRRSSQYRGVTRHRWTGRYEAHLWDSTCERAPGSTKGRQKGKQVYLGGYSSEIEAARAFDRAAIKYWGTTAQLNFPVEDYLHEVEAIQSMSTAELIANLRRKSSGFSRGASKFRGVTRHHQHGRWEARIGRVLGNKYLYLGTFPTEEDAARAYDRAAIRYRGARAVTNFNRTDYDNDTFEDLDALAAQAVSADGVDDDVDFVDDDVDEVQTFATAASIAATTANGAAAAAPTAAPDAQCSGTQTRTRAGQLPMRAAARAFYERGGFGVPPYYDQSQQQQHEQHHRLGQQQPTAVAEVVAHQLPPPIYWGAPMMNPLSMAMAPQPPQSQYYDLGDDFLLCEPTPLLDLLSGDLPGFDTHC